MFVLAVLLQKVIAALSVLSSQLGISKNAIAAEFGPLLLLDQNLSVIQNLRPAKKVAAAVEQDEANAVSRFCKNLSLLILGQALL